ncbi:MAG: GAF domain-containing protein [Chloroflexi bacterium]|nr:GAF domain-containing protein [Chloroflexota bacterium]MCI0581157.1 GAF domain-containing protein [Chloroflexota bacterium]MCI0645373.1 GAF domain-containing protein [Chloroflexota bacterium]MCI0727196.1 GAF domain-containing protein [Chloroflexota bacterium]
MSQQRILKAIQEVSTAICSMQTLDEVLTVVCRVVVQLFKVDHSGLVVFDAGFNEGKVVAEFPNLGTRGIKIPVRGVPAEEQLIESQQPLIVDNVTAETPLGPVQELLGKFDIQSILIMPVVFQGQILGSFSLDTVRRSHIFTPTEIALCQSFAAQVAIAVKNALLLEETKKRADHLETLRQTTLALTSELDRDRLLGTIIQQAVKLLGSKSGGIDQYHPEEGYLEVVADYGRPKSMVGRTLKVGQGMSGRLVQSKQPYIIVSDYRNWPFRVEEFAHDRTYRSVIAVPLLWQEEIIGVLYTDDVLGREFTEKDAGLLRLFADQAAIAFVHAELGARDTRRLKRLEKLSRAISTIMADLGNASLDRQLHLIARYATRILEAEGCGISLVRRTGFLSFEASYGYKPGRIKKGTEYAVQSGERSGLSGHIAYSGELFNKHGEELASHFAVKGSMAPPIESQHCYSLLAIPLVKREGGAKRLIGLLRVDNKKDKRGQTRPALYFDQEDEWILRLFADAAVMVIEAAGLVEKLNEQKEQFGRLVAHSPNGIIANDKDGTIKVFNEQAEAILKYRPEEIIGQPVVIVYEDPKEAGRVGEWVRENGRLTNYETQLVSKDGERIPIRLTATKVTNGQGALSGYVGYFVDMRVINETRERLELLSAASNLLAQAESLTEGLQQLAHMIVTYWGTTFCRIFLLDSDEAFLTTAAVYPLADPVDGLKWQPGVGRATPVAEWPRLTELLYERDASVLRMSGKQSRPILEKWSRLLGLTGDIQSMLVVPLRARDKVVGLLDLGELRPWDQAPFTKEKQNLAIAIAQQTAVLIDRFRLHETTKLAEKRLSASYEASNALVSSQDPDQVWQDMVKQMRRVAKAAGVRMVLIDPIMKEAKDLIRTETEKLDLRSAFRTNGLSMEIMLTGRPRKVEDAQQERDRVNPSFFNRGIVAALGLPVSVEGKRIGVVWVYYDESHHFSRAEIKALQLYVNQAAIAYENARQIKELAYMHRAAEALAGAPSLRDVLNQIVISACRVLAADSAFIWSYDTAHQKFNLENSVAFGVPDELWPRFQKQGPRPGGTADTVMKVGWVGVQDLMDVDSYPFLGTFTQELLKEVGVRSFQGVALSVNEEKLGVLYVNYNQRRSFSEAEQETARTFANHAALALKKTKLLEQVSKAHRVAGSVASVTTLAKLEDTLLSIAQGMYDALDCDVVTLYDFDRERQRLGHPPKIIGAYYPEKAHPPSSMSRKSLVYQVLQSEEEMIVAGNVAEHPLFKKSRFAREEEIASCIVVPLRMGRETVGVMFINYRQPHEFTQEELGDIELFANQAAVAIHNAQLYEREQKQTLALQALGEAAHAITRSLDLDEILYTIAEQAVNLTGAAGTRARYSHLGLLAGKTITFKATYPREHLPELQRQVGSINLEKAERIGVTGRAVAKGQPVLVTDVTKDNYYIAYHPETRSEIAVPIKRGAEVVGVINVEHYNRDAFDGQDLRALATLAEYAAMAIHNADLYQRKKKHAAVLEALHEAVQAVTSTLDLNEILNRIAEQASRVVRLQEQQSSYSSIWLVTGESKLQPTAAFPAEDLALAQVLVGDGIDWHTGIDGRIGVIGRVLKTGQPVLVPDVNKNFDYLRSHRETLSELAVPMKLGQEIIGVINVEHSDYDGFDHEDVNALQSLAAQAAVAIRNAQEHREVKVLQELAASLAGPLELSEVLTRVMTAAMTLTNTNSCCILFWDAKAERFAPAYRISDPEQQLTAYETTARTNGFTREIFTTGRPIVVPDTQHFPNVNTTMLQKGRLSTVGVAVTSEETVIAVLYVHSPKPRHFSGHQVAALETLANQAAVAIYKAYQYEELMKTKGLVGARTALAWMGMASNAWRHSLVSDVVNIRNAVIVLRPSVQKAVTEPTALRKIEDKLDLIERRARQVLERPITPPLSSEEGAEAVVVNDLIGERLGQLWENEPYATVDGPYLYLETTQNVKVWVSPQWLRLALDLLVGNAVEAMSGSKIRRLDVTGHRAGNCIKVAVKDTGKGIAPEVLALLFSGTAPHPSRDGRLGRGLLMVQAIVETYGGKLEEPITGPEGTVMTFSLPILS